jgi:hypothetical protein
MQLTPPSRRVTFYITQESIWRIPVIHNLAQFQQKLTLSQPEFGLFSCKNQQSQLRPHWTVVLPSRFSLAVGRERFCVLLALPITHGEVCAAFKMRSVKFFARAGKEKLVLLPLTIKSVFTDYPGERISSLKG